jgi:nudix-type nucleoside diphosphatase (YffH/AdpP family)
MRRFEVLEVQRVFQEFFAVDRAIVRFEQIDGTMSASCSRLSVERGDAVGLIVLDKDLDRLIFVRQFRYPTVRHNMPWTVECAAGAIDAGETAIEAARRELEEELGYRAADLIHLGDFFSSPGGVSEQLTMYFVEVGAGDRVSHGGGLAQEGEDLERVEFSRDEVSSMLLNNGFHDAKTLVGVLQAKLRGLF